MKSKLSVCQLNGENCYQQEKRCLKCLSIKCSEIVYSLCMSVKGRRKKKEKKKKEEYVLIIVGVKQSE